LGLLIVGNGACGQQKQKYPNQLLHRFNPTFNPNNCGGINMHRVQNQNQPFISVS